MLKIWPLKFSWWDRNFAPQGLYTQRVLKCKFASNKNVTTCFAKNWKGSVPFQAACWFTIYLVYLLGIGDWNFFHALFGIHVLFLYLITTWSFCFTLLKITHSLNMSGDQKLCFWLEDFLIVYYHYWQEEDLNLEAVVALPHQEIKVMNIWHLGHHHQCHFHPNFVIMTMSAIQLCNSLMFIYFSSTIQCCSCFVIK